jgi:hypothetical protein
VQEIAEEAVGKTMRTLWVLWGKLLLSFFLYVIICLMLEDYAFASFRPVFLPAYVKSIFYFAAVSALGLSCYLRSSLLRVRAGKSRDRIIKRAARLNRSPVIVKYNASVIVSLAMVQYAPLLCVILFFLGGGIKALYVFVVASLVTMLILRPNRKELDRLSVQWCATVNGVSH